MAAQTFKIAAIPADGVGKEVVAAGRRVLDTLAAQSEGKFAFDWEEFPWGSEYYEQTGKMMADDGLDTLKSFDAIYFGAVGWHNVPDHISLWGLRLNITQNFDQWANIRPVKFLPGVVSPLRKADDTELDWVVIRENSEGEYAGTESPKKQGTLWAGTDDGLVHVTTDDGKNWANVTPKMPEWSTVSIIDPSPHDATTAYVAVDRHRLDDFKPYIFKTTDLGKSWSTNHQWNPGGRIRPQRAGGPEAQRHALRRDRAWCLLLVRRWRALATIAIEPAAITHSRPGRQGR